MDSGRKGVQLNSIGGEQVKRMLSNWLQKDGNSYTNTGWKPGVSAVVVYQSNRLQVVARTLSSSHMKVEGK